MYRRPKYNKLKVYQMKLRDGVLAYRVLKSANLSEENEKLARATITTLTYKSMTEQLKKIFGDMSKRLSQQVNLKAEPTFHNENLGPDEEVNFGNRGRFQYKGKRSHSTYRGRNNRPWRNFQGRASTSESWRDPQNRANIQERTQQRIKASNNRKIHLIHLAKQVDVLLVKVFVTGQQNVPIIMKNKPKRQLNKQILRYFLMQFRSVMLKS